MSRGVSHLYLSNQRRGGDFFQVDRVCRCDVTHCVWKLTSGNEGSFGGCHGYCCAYHFNTSECLGSANTVMINDTLCI